MPIFIPPDRVRHIAALTTEIERARNAIAAITAEVDRLDARLQYLTRDRRRSVTRDALSILRRAGAPMATRALTVAVMTEHHQDTTDGALVRLNRERLRICLLRHRANGIVTSAPGVGRTVVWAVAG
jgi:hypothetical protein